jgi:predicted S18 family serine protease
MMKNYEIFILMFVVLVIGIIIGTSFQETEIRVLKPTDIIQSEIMLVAVDNNNEGVIIPLIVEVRPGNGKVLTDIDKLLFWVDTQFSIQTAKEVAEDVTGIDASNYDITYSIGDENVTIVGGASAGAALTVATMAA